MWSKIGDSETWTERRQWLHCEVEGRFVSLIEHGGQLYCIDSVCYHAGGPLAVGEIEEVDGRPCVRCPWHHYAITIDTGEKLHKALEMNSAGKLVPAGWKRCAALLRAHNARASRRRRRSPRLAHTINPRSRAASRTGSARTASRSARTVFICLHRRERPRPARRRAVLR